MDPGHLWYALAWASFGLLHSVLAARSVKARLGSLFGRAYRLAYNGFAVFHLALVWGLGRLWLDGAPYGLPRAAALLADAATVAGVVIVLVALLGYDRRRLLGLRQLREPDSDEDEPLRIDGLHRYVRHPLYSGLFLVLWGNAQSDFGLATAAWGSVYLLVGTWFEERRLIDLYGDAYLGYRRSVPAFIPWRGRLTSA